MYEASDMTVLRFCMCTMWIFVLNATMSRASSSTVAFIPVGNKTVGMRLVNGSSRGQVYASSRESHCVQMCILEHTKNGACSSVNYDSSTSQCVINDLHPRDDPSSIALETALSWTWYDLNHGPPEIPSLTVMDSSDSSIKLSWSSGFNGGFQQDFKFEYRASSDNSFTSWDDAILDEGTGVNVEEVIVGLLPKTTYVIRLTSSNSRPFGVNEIYTEVTTKTHYKASCADHKNAGSTSSGTYVIDPDGAIGVLSPFSVFCNLTADPPETIFHHDQESEQEAAVSCQPMCHVANITYNNSVSMDQVAAVINNSTTCSQFFRKKCLASRTSTNTATVMFAAWFTRNHVQRIYWGGSDEVTGGCGCYNAGGCAGGQKCNCDANDDVWREDSGYLTTKADLPMTQLYLGDLNKNNEQAFITIGPLVCT